MKKEIKNQGGRPSTKNKQAMLLYRILKPLAEGEEQSKWIHLKCETRLHENKAAAKAMLLDTIEKEQIEFPVEYEIFLVMENRILKPVTTVKFVEEAVPEAEVEEPIADELQPENEEPTNTEDDLGQDGLNIPENEEPTEEVPDPE